MRRTFFALWPEPAWCERLLRAAQVPLSHGNGRAVANVDLHVTLCFLGAVGEPEIAALRARAAALRAVAFELEFDALEYWPRSRILALSSSRVPAAASELAGALRVSAAAVGIRVDGRALRPHVTLMRGMAAGSQPATLASFVPMRLDAQRFYLAQSHELGGTSTTSPQPNRYARLDSWPLLER